MNPEELQPPQSTMTGDQSAAALSFATMLSEGLMPKAMPEAPQEPESAPGEAIVGEGEEPQPEPTKEPVETEIEPSEESKKLDTLISEFEVFKTEMKELLKPKTEE